MENNQTKASAKDFFLNLGVIAALYTVVISLINLLFRVINVAFPQTLNTYSYFGSQSISLPVATLIIVFPVFILLSWLLEKGYELEPEKRHLSVKKWLSYITLFISGIVLAGDLVTVLYYFLDGQEMTAAFIMKVATVLLVTAMVFVYYISDIRDRLNSGSRKAWLLAATCLLLISIVWGFVVLGSPRTQRLLKQDNNKIMDLQSLQWQVINYWQAHGSLPDVWTDMMVDTQTAESYEYKKIGPMTFALCANFNREGNIDQGFGMMRQEVGYPTKTMMQDWRHGRGQHCFERVIDPIAYPIQIKG